MKSSSSQPRAERTYTEDEKQHALEVWRTQGASAAARSVNCSRQTIYNWVDEYNLRGEQDREAVYQYKRDNLKFNLMEKVYFILTLMKSPVQGVVSYQGEVTFYTMELPTASDINALTKALQTLMDVIHLEEGEPTSRVESIDGNILDNELVQLANELADRATGKVVKELPSETDLQQQLRDMELESKGKAAKSDGDIDSNIDGGS